MKVNIFLLVFSFTFAFGNQIPYEYPFPIPEIGDIIVTSPIIRERPPGAEIILPVRREIITSHRRFSLIPRVETISLDSVLRYFTKDYLIQNHNCSQLDTELDYYLLDCLKFHINHFNPSLIEDIHEPFKILSFAIPFFKLFKVAYPGLFRVKLSKPDIVVLCYIASGWFLGDEGEAIDQDSFFHHFIKNYSDLQGCVHSYHLDLFQLKSLGFKYAYQAALNLSINNIHKRNIFLLEDLKPAACAYKFLNDETDWQMFDQIISLVRDVNDADASSSDDSIHHVLIAMIVKGHFNEEIMLRPELKAHKFSEIRRQHFEDFYSEALYFAISYENCLAIQFLLNLDYKTYYADAKIPEPEDSEYDSDNSACMPWLYEHPDPIDEKKFSIYIKGLTGTRGEELAATKISINDFSLPGLPEDLNYTDELEDLRDLINLDFPGLHVTEDMKVSQFEELGDLYFTEPLLFDLPEHAEILHYEPIKSLFWNSNAILTPRIIPIYSIIDYFNNNSLLYNILYMNHAPPVLSSSDVLMIESLKLQMNHFNPSILDGSNDNSIVLSFGISFFRLFKATYPGLFRVRLNKSEIVVLCYLAFGWYSLDLNSESMMNLLGVYHPECIPNFSKFDTNLRELLDLNMNVAFKAFLSGSSRKVRKNNYGLFSKLRFESHVEELLTSHRWAFDQVIAAMPNVNDASVEDDDHIIFKMIQVGHFNESAMLKPELKYADGCFRNNSRFRDFYSSALYYAVNFGNMEALRFLLNLEYESYYVVKESVDSVPIEEDLFNRLRIIFLSSTADEIVSRDPKIKDIKFCQFDIYSIIEKFRDSSEAIKNLANLL